MVCTSEQADTQITQPIYREAFIQTFESDVVVLSFGYANIVKDAGFETFSVVYQVV